MRTSEQLKAFLVHEDEGVREAVAQYFADCWSRDEGLIPLALEACERYGYAANRGVLQAADRFVVSERALDAVLGHLGRASDELTNRLLNKIVVSTPGALLVGRETALLEHPGLEHELVPRLRRRRDYVDWPAERLWEELQAFARRSSNAVSLADVDLSYAEDLVNALGRHATTSTATMIRLLNELDPDEEDSEGEGWLEIFLVQLAGERRLREAVSVLVDKLDIDADILQEESLEALAKIGDPDAVHLIQERFAPADDGFKIYASDVLRKIKHPEAEATIVALLETETEPACRTILSSALCAHFSERVVEIVRKEIEAGYDTGFTTLEDELLPVAEVLGVGLPEAARWRAEREERNADASKIEEIDLFSWPGCGEGWFEPAEDDEDTEAAEAVGAFASVVQPVETIRHTVARVGRNDPCPCGSGKKFKQCCARKG